MATRITEVRQCGGKIFTYHLIICSVYIADVNTQGIYGCISRLLLKVILHVDVEMNCGLLI